MIPVILITSVTEISSIIHGLDAGADYFLTKPYSEDVMLVRVADILSAGNPGGNNPQKASVAVRLKNKIETFDLDPQKILNFFISTYENLISHNTNLTTAKKELKILSDNLEQRVREKTFYLEEAEEALKNSLQSLKRTLGGTVKALAGTIEMRDPYTAGHQRRVAQLACAIGKEMDFPEEKLEGLQVIGFIHDIGKIIVPAEILSRPGELNEIEFNLIKFHPQVGCNILREIEFPWPVADAVAQHHERIDGSGYPHNLKGDDILIEAKIIAVAEVVESMASHRPYRPAMSIDAGLAEIVKNRGILFDEAVVDSCVRVFRKNDFQFDDMNG
jgi:putative nucleotidyltransferase with HDIG domain